MMKLPLHCLVVMVGPSGAGKSTFINKTFKPHEVVSTDNIREELTGDFRNQHQNRIVFEEFYHRIRTKLNLGERVVADATHLRKKDRLKTANIGAEFHVPVFYMVVNRPLRDKLATAGWREEVPGLIQKHEDTFKGQLKDILAGDNLATVIDLRDIRVRKGVNTEIEIVQKLDFYNLETDLLDRGYTSVRILGDVHGMSREFKAEIDSAIANNEFIISLGDVVDYGPDSVGCVDLMYRLVINGQGIMIVGNHERKLEKYILQRREGNIRVQVSGGLLATVGQLDRLGDKKRELFETRFLALMSHSRHHFRLGLNLFVHGSATTKMWDTVSFRLSGIHEQRAVFAQVDENDPFREDGFPNRVYHWIDEIPEGHTVYVGHDFLDLANPVEKVGALGGKAVFVDTGSGKERDGVAGSLSSVVIKI